MRFFFDKEKNSLRDLVQRIARLCEGLVYISETDAPITVFTGGPVDELNSESIIAFTRSTCDVRIEDVDFDKFFARLTKKEAWHNDANREQTRKFLELQKLLEENLNDLKGFKIGAIRVAIYIVGLDKNNNVIGLKTDAVET